MEKPDKPSKETLDQWSKDPNNWVSGIFYYNKKDKRVFPPKRIPWMGYTVNFANPVSVLFIVIFLLFFILIATTTKN